MAILSIFSRPTAPELKPPPKIKFHYQDPLLVDKLGAALSQYLQMLDPDNSRPVVVISIGTDRSTGDCLGPLVGMKLEDAGMDGLYVYGTLDEPVHANNLAEKIEMVQLKHPNCLIIAIDACLGQSDSVGAITLAAGPVKPGAGVNKNLPPVGELHFTGIVNVGGYMEYFVLQNTRLSLVMKMAELMAAAICNGFYLAREDYPSFQAETARSNLQ